MSEEVVDVVEPDVEPDVIEESSTSGIETEGLSTEEIKQGVTKAPPEEMGDAEKGRARYLARKLSKASDTLVAKQARIDELEEEISAHPKVEVKFPKQEDFDTDDRYQEAVADHTLGRLRSEIQADKSADVRKREEEAISKQSEPFWDKVDKLDQSKQDEVTEAVANLLDNKTSRSVLPSLVQDYLIQSDVGPELLVHMDKHPAIAAKIAGLGQFQIVRELDKIQGNLIAAKTSKTVTGAPTPITPIGEGNSTLDKDIDSMSGSETEAWLRKIGSLNN